MFLNAIPAIGRRHRWYDVCVKCCRHRRHHHHPPPPVWEFAVLRDTDPDLRQRAYYVNQMCVPSPPPQHTNTSSNFMYIYTLWCVCVCVSVTRLYFKFYVRMTVTMRTCCCVSIRPRKSNVALGRIEPADVFFGYGPGGEWRVMMTSGCLVAVGDSFQHWLVYKLSLAYKLIPWNRLQIALELGNTWPSTGKEKLQKHIFQTFH